MASLAEIKALQEQTQVSLDAEQARVAELLAEKDATIATLGTTITSLEALVAAGGTEEQRQAILDGLTTLKADLEATVE